VENTLANDTRRKPKLAAYECLLRGIKHLRGYGPGDNARAIELFEQAIALDPDYQLARVYRVFADLVAHGYDAAPDHVVDAALAVASTAVEIEGDDGRLHWLLAMICGSTDDVEREARHYQRAIELNPNDANAIACSGISLVVLGHKTEGLERFRMAMRLNPYHPEWYWDDLGTALYAARRYTDAVEAFSHRTQPGCYTLSPPRGLLGATRSNGRSSRRGRRTPTATAGFFHIKAASQGLESRRCRAFSRRDA
jgi:tetratricopeptide (TPR) repeat protein